MFNNSKSTTKTKRCIKKRLCFNGCAYSSKGPRDKSKALEKKLVITGRQTAKDKLSHIE